MKCSSLFLFMCLALRVGSVAAHHGAYEYDFNTVAHIEGTITEYHWRNPHAFIHLSHRNEAGDIVELVIEAAGPSGLTPLGVTSSSLTPGERVVAIVFPSRRSPATSAHGREIVKQDNTTVPLHPQFAPKHLLASTGTTDTIFGTWVPSTADFFRLIFGRSQWPLTKAGSSAFQRYDVAISPAAKCIPLSSPTIMLYPTAHTLRIIEDQIIIDTDVMDAQRVVFMDGRNHPDPTKRFHQGHSVGHWDDETLIIDTTNFTENRSGLTFGIPSSEGKHIVERVRLAADRAHLEVEYWLEDPQYLTEPVLGLFRWMYRPDVEPSGEPCDLATARRYLTTSQDG